MVFPCAASHDPQESDKARVKVQNEAPTAFCDASDRIRHWVLTGRHVVEHDASKPKKHGTGSLTIREEEGDSPNGFSSPSSSSSSSSSANGQLDGCDDDLLIPTAAEINRTFRMAQHTWQRFVSRAKAIPPTSMPSGACDPSIMLKDVPAIPPHKMSKSGIQGAAVWRRRTGEDDGEETLSHGLEKGICLNTPAPLACRLSPSLSDQSGGTCPPPEAAKGLAILTLCWSYILSAKLLELQDQKATYPKTCLRPTLATAYVARRNEYVLNLQSPASDDLVRWLCIVLAPGPGCRWPPTWAARASADIRFIILTDKPAVFDSDKPQPPPPPPGSSRAAELLIELCSLFGLGETPRRGRPARGEPQSEPLLPYTAAFLAALALPLYGSHGLEPQLALAPLERRSPPTRLGETSSIRQADAERIRQYVADLQYYMTLSADDLGLHSVMWSVFWQPDIPCNLVSPWLGGILDVLRPLIDTGDVATLVKTLALRRPRVALWWLGALFLGSPDILSQMALWLETTEGRYGRGLAAISYPDLTASAWTGSPNSFWETEQGTGDLYPDAADMVLRADVLRCRLNHNLQDRNWNFAFCWRPFGHVRKGDVELDIWPSLEQGFAREYAYWVWSIDGGPVVRLGFRRETGRFVDHIYDDMEVVEPPRDCCCLDGNIVVGKRPTVVAVGKMLAFFMTDVHGGIDEGNAALPGYEKHKWQKHWNIRPSRW